MAAGKEQIQLHVKILRENQSYLIEHMDLNNTLFFPKMLEKSVLTRKEIDEIKVNQI